MKKTMILFFVVSMCWIILISESRGRETGIGKEITITGEQGAAKGPGLIEYPNFGKTPLYFIPNKGQIDETARYYAKTPRYTLGITKQGLVFDRIKELGDQGSAKGGLVERDVSRLIFINANNNTEILPLEMTQHHVNYFIGNDPSRWQKSISTSKAVLYKDIYKNIDLKVYGNESQVEYDWIVKPGGNPADIRFEYKSIQATNIDREGNLIIDTPFGKMMHQRPHSFQMLQGEKVKVSSGFRQIEKNSYGFSIGKYDKNFELILDPVVSLLYSSYMGGSDTELYTRMFLDKWGQVHLIGYTYSIDYPTKNAYQGSKNYGLDAIVTKLNAAGSDLIFSTYFGGNSYEYFFGITAADNGDVYIAGDTFSDDMPAFNSPIGWKDVFLARFDANGNYLGGRYLGGTDEDRNSFITLDNSNHLWVTGFTYSTDFPTKNPYQSMNMGDASAYACKLSPDLKDIEYSTYLGGSSEEVADRIAVDKAGYFFVVGRTGSSDFPLKNAWQNHYGGGERDVFLTKFKPNGSQLVFSTFLGGTGDDMSFGLAIGNSGDIYVGGFTTSTDFPTKNPYQATNHGDYDIFISRFNSDGSKLLYSSYLGGSREDWHGVLALDNDGYISLAGSTHSSDFPTKSPLIGEYQGNRDGFFSILTPDGKYLVYSSYWGGSEWERCLNIDRDSAGNIYLAGETESYDFPVLNAYQPSNGGYADFFVSKFSFDYGKVGKISLNRSRMNFSVTIPKTPRVSKYFYLRFTGNSPLAWTVAASDSWLSCSPTNGTGNAKVAVLVNASALVPGIYRGVITVNAPDAINSPQTIDVILTVHTTGTSGHPPRIPFEL